MALLAILGALVLFWISTRQFSWIVRTAIWIAGAALLGWAIFGSAPEAEFGLRRALENAWLYRSNLGDAAIVQAFKGNALTVARFIPQLADFFVVAAIILGALSLLAFTKGEGLEVWLRPTILALIAFIAGSLAALAVVAIGLGGQVKPRTFLGYVSPTAPNGEESVHDGDTFWLGEISLRLWGVDAPELNQICLGVAECGEASRTHLREFLVGSLVQCDQKQSLRSGRLTESFGRPLVQCWRIDGDHRIDVARWMIQNGYAVQYEGNDAYGYGEDEADAYAVSAGLFRGCSLRPDVWRSRQSEFRAARSSFERDNSIQLGVPTMGACQQYTQ